MSLYTTLNRLFSKVATSLDGIKTGYDGTQYETAGEAVRQQISDLHVLIERDPVGGSVPSDVRTALSTLLQAGAYTETGLTDEMNVVRAWAETVTSITLSAETINVQGSTPVQLTAVTEPSGKTVSWRSLNSDIATVSNTGLVTGVNNGNAVIVASSGDISARCTATVTGFISLTAITATYTQSGTVYDTTALDDLKNDLVVTATYDDSTTAIIPSTDYTLSGTLSIGTSTITVSHGGKTTTFDVVVSEDTHGIITDITWTRGALASSGGINTTDSNGSYTTDYIPMTAGQTISFSSKDPTWTAKNTSGSGNTWITCVFYKTNSSGSYTYIYPRLTYDQETSSYSFDSSSSTYTETVAVRISISNIADETARNNIVVRVV